MITCYKRQDVLNVIDRFAGYLDEDMIYRLKFAIQRDCPPIALELKDPLESTGEM